MKTIKDNLRHGMLISGLCMGILTFSACNSNDNDENADPCEQLSCLNGGEAIPDVEFDICRCNCPTGYAGENCETKIAECPVTVECPIGQTPNPENDCQCE